MHDIIDASAASLARAIRAKELSSAEVVQAYLQRLEAVNPQLNAVVQLRAEAAQAEAKAADAALARGQIMGPLHGVPMTIKDSLDTAGVITTGGTTGRATYVPAQDATVVARLRHAGAILLGKTNPPELTLAGEAGEQRCMAWRMVADEQDLRVSGWLCGGAGKAVDRRSLTCFAERLDLPAGQTDKALRALFSAAERARTSECPTPRPLLAGRRPA